MQNKRGPELKNGVQDGCLVPISKRAIKKAAKLLFDTELMGVKRMREVVRWAEKR